MKVALVTTEFFPFRGGGIGTYCESITRALVDKGHEVHVITSVPGPQTVYGATVHRCPIPYYTPGEFSPAKFAKSDIGQGDENYLASYCWAIEISKIVDQYGIEVIECQECMAPMFYYLYHRILDPDVRHVPVITHLHTPNYEIALWDRRPMESPAMHTIRFMEDFTIRMSDAILSPSRFLASHVSGRLSGIEQQVEVIPYPSFENEAYPDSRINSVGKELLFVGRLEHRKGIEILVRALAIIMVRYGDVRARFIGKSTHSHVYGIQYRQWIQEQLQTFPDRIVFDGLLGRKDILERMHSANCVIIPSIGENFPNVCMEAMLSGSLIIAADSGGMGEMMGDDCGYLFKGSDVDSLVSVIEDVLALPDHVISEKRQRARTKIREYCDIDRISELRIKHYTKVIAAAAAGNRPSQLSAIHFGGYEEERQKDIATIRTVTAVVTSDGTSLSSKTIESLTGSRRQPDEILIVHYGVGPNKSDIQFSIDKLPVPARIIKIVGSDIATIRNFALKNVQTDALFFMGTTDVIDPDYIGGTIAILDRQPAAGYVQTWVKCLNHDSTPVPPFLPFFLYNHCFVNSLGMFRISALRETGGFPAGMNFHYLDWQVVLSLLKTGWITLVMDRVLAEADLPDAVHREQIDVLSGNIMYEQLVMRNQELFLKYRQEVILTAGSLLATRGVYLNNRLSILERKLLGIYRKIRNNVEKNVAKVPYLRRMVNR